MRQLLCRITLTFRIYSKMHVLLTPFLSAYKMIQLGTHRIWICLQLYSLSHLHMVSVPSSLRSRRSDPFHIFHNDLIMVRSNNILLLCTLTGLRLVIPLITWLRMCRIFTRVTSSTVDLLSETIGATVLTSHTLLTFYRTTFGISSG